MAKLKHLKITTTKIAALNPCESRFLNWRSHYETFSGDVIDFLSLDQITAKDKIWVCIRILPRDLVETFAVNSAFSAQLHDAAAYAAAAYAADAADAAAYAAAAYAADAADAAAYAAAADAAADAAVDADAAASYAADAASYAAYAAAADAAAYAAVEREAQVDALIWLINDYENN